MKMHLTMSSGKWRTFYPGGDELINMCFVPQTGGVSLLEDGSLMLRPVQLSQTGRYTCTAYNGGNTAVASARLTVICK